MPGKATLNQKMRAAGALQRKAKRRGKFLSMDAALRRVDMADRQRMKNIERKRKKRR